MERKGASYKITQTRPAQTHDDHAQRTQATVASEMYGGEGVRPPGVTGAGMPNHPRPPAFGGRAENYPWVDYGDD
jgi:hypothetical protein